EPVEPFGLVRRRRRDGRGRDAPFGAGAARKGVWTTAGTSEGDVALNLQRLDHVVDVGDDIDYRAAGIGGRAAVPGTVVAADAQRTRAPEREVGRVDEAATGRSVMLDDDAAVWVAGVVDVQRPAVAQGDVELAHSPGLSGVPGRPLGKISASRRATGGGTS